MAPRPMFDRMAHIGAHKQQQEGLNWIGVVLPVGKLTCEQMRGLAKIAHDLGDGDIRLTVWQNLLLSSVRDENVALASAAIEQLGLAVTSSQIRAGLVACTGMPAASSRPPTPSAMPPQSAIGASRGSISRRRSTSI